MADLILEPSKNSSTKSLGKSFTDSAASIVSGLEMLLKIAAGVGIVVFGIRGIYASWFPHTLSSVVHTSGNWTEGKKEFRPHNDNESLSVGLYCHAHRGTTPTNQSQVYGR
jgi:hypothetical protein